MSFFQKPTQPQVNTQDDSLADIGIDNPSNAPMDTVASLQWMPNNQMRILSASTWDGKIHLYDVAMGGFQKYLTQKMVYTSVNEPILSISWKKDSSMIFAGCGDNTVKAFDVNTGKSMVLGSHDGPVNSVYWIEQLNVIMSTSFNQQIKFWQLGNQNAVFNLNSDARIFTSDLNFPYVFLGMSNDQLNIFDLNQMNSFPNGKLIGNFQTPLTSQTNCLSLFSKNDGYGIGSIDGRANLSTIEKQNVYGNNPNGPLFKSNSKMTFKCHKIEENNNINILLPVNSIGFHPNSKSFVYTAGGDGVINFWDHEAKNKIKTLNFKGVPVNRVKISDDGQLMAYALGYDWQKGIWGMDPAVKPKICVHIMAENELKYNQQTSWQK